MHTGPEDFSDIPQMDSWRKKTYSAYFEYRGAQRGSQRLRNFNWWQRVMLRIIDKTDAFRLECASGDEEGKLFCARLGATDSAAMHVEGNKEIWEGDMLPRFTSEFIDRPFDDQGRVKWSAVMLKSDGRTIVAITQHGSRIGMHGVLEDDLEYFAGAVHSLSFSFYYWENGQSGQTVHFQPIYAFEGDLGDIITAYQKGKEED